ncbi:MAG TPA: response regulator transcription factor [Arachnia sp.]|nr:response regulator transcription factor [Arachnia sp.]HMT87590.1 response regulator transcription factor [Arachnia sp.]
MDELRIALVDDDPVVLAQLPALLAPHGVVVSWTAADGRTALGHLSVSGRLPDVLVIDVKMPGLSGHEVAQRAIVLHPTVPVLMYTSIDSEDSLRDALACGARGYVVKHDPPEHIALLLRLAAAGGLAVSNSPGRRLAEDFSAARPDVETLTERQREVLRLASQGRSNDAIAKRLGCSVDTVKKHFTAIFERLDTRDRAAAVAKAIRAGILRGPD